MKMVKEHNFIYFINLLFDTRFGKYYYFSLHSHETVVNKQNEGKMLKKFFFDIFQHALIWIINLTVLIQ